MIRIFQQDLFFKADKDITGALVIIKLQNRTITNTLTTVKLSVVRYIILEL